jgi:hypothetical protein
MNNTDDYHTPSEYLLIFRGKDWDEGLSPQALQTVMDRFKAWSDGLCKSGKVKSGQALGREGKLISGPGGRYVADGPFAESKETIGGYLLVRAESLDEALAIARTSPGLDYGGAIEVRPVLDECPVFKRARERFGLVPA